MSKLISVLLTDEVFKMLEENRKKQPRNALINEILKNHFLKEETKAKEKKTKNKKAYEMLNAIHTKICLNQGNMSNKKNPRTKTVYYNKEAMEAITSYAEQEGISFNKACNELIKIGGNQEYISEETLTYNLLKILLEEVKETLKEVKRK